MRDLKKKALLIVLFPSVSFAISSEPNRPVFNEAELDALIKRSAYTAFIGDACSISHAIPDQMRKVVRTTFADQGAQEQKISLFSSFKSHFSQDANSLSIFKKCNIDGGKTRSLVNDVGRQLEDVYQATSGTLTKYQNLHSQWEFEVQQERAERELLERNRIAAERAAHDEKIKDRAVTLSDELGKFIVSSQYQGGSSIGVNLISYEYFESSKTMRLKVEMRWNGKLTGDSGYAADGEIKAIFDDASNWVIGKNVSWNPTYQSSMLNDWISQRQYLRALDALSK